MRRHGAAPVSLAATRTDATGADKALWRRLATSTAIVLALSAYAASAQDTNWSGATDTTWETAGNWAEGLPAGGLNAIIGNTTNTPVINDGITGVADNVTVNSGGNLQVDGVLELQGSADVTGTLSIGTTGRLEGDVTTNDTGVTTIDGTVTGAVTGLAGSLTDLNGGTINGAVTTAGNLEAAGTINGGLTLTGGALVTSETTGNLTVTGPTSNGAGFTVSAGDTFTGALTTTGSGVTTIDGTVTGAVTGLAGSLTDLNGAVTGTVVTAGTLTVSDAASVSGALTNRGNLTATIPGGTSLSFTAGSLDNSGSIGGTAGGTLIVTASTITLRTGTSLVGDVSLRGAIFNHADLTFGPDSQLYGTFTNEASGQFTVNGLLNAGNFGIVNGGTLTIGSTIENLLSLENGGTAALTADSVLNTATVTNRAGATLTSEGTITGTLNNSGNATVTGSIGGDLGNAGTLFLSGSVAGGLTNSGSTTVNGPATSRSVGNTGTLTIADAGTLTSTNTVINAVGGTVEIQGTLNGGLANSGTTDFVGGALTGGLTSNGTLTASGINTITGAVSVTGGSFTLHTGADVTVRDVTTGVAMPGTVSIGSAGRLTLTGTLHGDVANAGTMTQTGTLDGDLTNIGAATLSGNISGDLTQSAGSLSIGTTAATTLEVGGTVYARTNIGIGAGRSLEAGAYEVGANTLTEVGGSLMTEDGLTNNGGLLLRNDGERGSGNGIVTGDVHGGEIYALGQTNITGEVTGATLISLTQWPGSTTGTMPQGSRLTLGSLSSSGATLAFDINLNQSLSAASTDVLEVTGEMTGSYNLVLNDHTNTGTQNRQAGDLQLINAGDNSNFSIDNIYGLTDSSLRYSHMVIHDEATGDVVIRTALDPAIAGVAGSVALSQSLIGAIVNRPTSPYTVGRAVADEEKNCAPGTWARATGGRANLAGETSSVQGASVNSYGSDISVTYGGLQVGADLSCFNGSIAGWDMAFGVMAGSNRGSGTQSSDNLVENVVASTSSLVTKNKFDQSYVGIYATASRGRLIADLQLRGEKTNFELSNDSIGLRNGELDVKAVTLSGALTGHIPLGDNGWSVLPTGGFMISRAKSSTLEFETGDSLTIKDHTTKLGFAGVAISKLQIAESGDRAVSYFATGTYYHDFSKEMQSSYILIGEPDPFSLSTSVLGSYGEVSIGMNFLKVLDKGENGRAPSQFNAAIRLDGRFSGDLDGVALTGQMRWQF